MVVHVNVIFPPVILSCLLILPFTLTGLRRSVLFAFSQQDLVCRWSKLCSCFSTFQQGTIHLSASSAGAASEMRARWRATNASTPGRSPMNVTAVGRSSASSTSWKPTTVCTQVLRSKQFQPRRGIAAFIDVDDQRIGKLFVVLRGVMLQIFLDISFCLELLVWLSHGLPDSVCEQRF